MGDSVTKVNRCDGTDVVEVNCPEIIVDLLSTITLVYICAKTLFTSKSHHFLAPTLRYFHTKFEEIYMCTKKVMETN